MNRIQHNNETPPFFGLSDLSTKAVEEIGEALRALLADVFSLYVKTKGFHWHMTGPHFRDYHLMLDEQADQILAMVDPIAERARKLGEPALQSIGDVVKHQRLRDNELEQAPPEAMLAELLYAHQELIAYLRNTHEVADRNADVATASLIENWIDETEQRAWFLFESLN